mgnify:CR=1 FL=1
MKYLLVFLVSMVPIIELRGALPFAMTNWMGEPIPAVAAYIICVIGNMVPVPFIYFFARKILEWGANKRYIGRFFRYCIRKGESGGRKLTASAAKKGGTLIALILFVGIPLPGTGAWTGTLGASFMNMGIKSTALSVSLGVILAGLIMGLASAGVFSIIGL